MNIKYYCDYCERSFPDNPDLRGQHFGSQRHKANVKMWYDSFKEPYELELEMRTPPCINWVKTRSCPLNKSCPFRHIGYGTNDSVVRVIPRKCLTNLVAGILPDDESGVLMEEWKIKENKLQPSLAYLPEALRNYANYDKLPPSLIPALKEEYNNLEFPEWGSDYQIN